MAPTPNSPFSHLEFTQILYFVCLFAESGDRVVLAVGEGVTDTNIKALADDRQRILSATAPPGGFQPGPASPGTLGQSASAKTYEQGVICYKAYARGSIPADDVLLNDVRIALEFVRSIADLTMSKNRPQARLSSVLDRGWWSVRPGIHGKRRFGRCLVAVSRESWRQ